MLAAAMFTFVQIPSALNAAAFAGTDRQRVVPERELRLA
jgi:hypothetical protein